MNVQVAAQAARELDKPHSALTQGRALLEGLDRAAAVLTLDEHRPWSPLRTMFEQALTTIEGVQELLRDAAQPPGPEGKP